MIVESKGSNFSMNILKREELIKKQDGVRVQGYVLIGNYTKQPTKNGSFFLSGTLECKGTMQFKVWANSGCFSDMDSYGFAGKICYVAAKVNEYQDNISLILEECRAVDEESCEFSKADFLADKYDIPSYLNSLLATIKKNVSDEAYNLYVSIMRDYIEAFKTEFAAVNHHDNVKGGLLAHTAKVLKIASIIRLYPEISVKVGADLLYLGIALHDIGKVVEYSSGTVSGVGQLCGHTTIGVMILNEHKSEIVSTMGEEFYYSLASIISQHHGEYGEPPRTVAAFVVNQLDCLDAVLTGINQKLEINKDTISYDSWKLS